MITNEYMKRRVLLPISKNGTQNISIKQFLDKVLEVSESEELAKNANSKKSFESETTMIQTCLNNGKKRFNFEIIDEEEGKASSMSPYTITFDITAGGRRSKTRRTKKGKRKGRGRKTRQRK